jgi:hypothetical protein
VANNYPLSPGGITHALLDANVLLPPRLSDVLFDLCLQGLYAARWTVDIEEEFLRNWARVVAKAGKSGSLPSMRLAAVERAKAYKRLLCYKGAVAEHEIFGHDNPAVLAAVPSAVDAGDKHVAAAGLVLLNYAQQFSDDDKVYIVSSNLRHLAVAEMALLGVSVVSPGQFIDNLTHADSTRVGMALEKSVSSLESPPYTREQLLGALHLHGALGTVEHFAGAWGVKFASR